MLTISGQRASFTNKILLQCYGPCTFTMQGLPRLHAHLPCTQNLNINNVCPMSALKSMQALRIGRISTDVTPGVVTAKVVI